MMMIMMMLMTTDNYNNMMMMITSFNLSVWNTKYVFLLNFCLFQVFSELYMAWDELCESPICASAFSLF